MFGPIHNPSMFDLLDISPYNHNRVVSLLCDLLKKNRVYYWHFIDVNIYILDINKPCYLTGMECVGKDIIQSFWEPQLRQYKLQSEQPDIYHAVVCLINEDELIEVVKKRGKAHKLYIYKTISMPFPSVLDMKFLEERYYRLGESGLEFCERPKTFIEKVKNFLFDKK